MVREWPGIDRLRLDKFYMLLMEFYTVGLQFLKQQEASSDSFKELVKEYMAILVEEGPLE